MKSAREDAERIVAAGIEKVKIRSVLTCHTRYGVCVVTAATPLVNR